MPPEPDLHTVTVTGTGTSRVAPDSAVARLAAVGRGAGVAEAYDAMTAAAATLVEVAGRHTEERRIGSTGVSVWPWHDQSGVRAGYEARHSFSIGCDDLAAAGAMRWWSTVWPSRSPRTTEPAPRLGRPPSRTHASARRRSPGWPAPASVPC